MLQNSVICFIVKFRCRTAMFWKRNDRERYNSARFDRQGAVSGHITCNHYSYMIFLELMNVLLEVSASQQCIPISSFFEMLLLLLMQREEESTYGSRRPRGTRASACVMSHDRDARVSTLRSTEKSRRAADRLSIEKAPTPADLARLPQTSGINQATKQVCCKAWQCSLLL